MVNNPNIRFAGFSDDWVQRKLGDFLTRAHRPTADRSLVTVGESQTKLRTQDNQGYNSKLTDIDMTKYAGINFGDVLVDLSSYSRGFYISTMDGLTSKAYHVLSHDFKEYRLIFLKYILVNRQILKQLPGITPVGARQGKSLQVGDVLNLNVSLPSGTKEQQKIGSIFSTLDHKIGLEERQISLLKDLKKGYLQKMFPKNGAKVPELRFAGFADEWEERKLKDIAQFNPKTVLPDEFEYVDLESVVGTEMISHRTESKDQAPSRAQRLAQKGDVFYQTVRPYQMNNYLYDLPYDNYVFSTGYAQMRPNIDSYFLLNSVQNKQFVQHVLDRSTGTSYPAINSSDLSNIEIHVPSKLSEQQKIGAFFKQLDDTIAANQRKLELLTDLKKGLLRQMFV